MSERGIVTSHLQNCLRISARKEIMNQFNSLKTLKQSKRKSCFRNTKRLALICWKNI